MSLATARRSQRALLKFLIAAAVLLAFFALTRTFWLTTLAKALVHDDGPAKAQYAVVLAGDYWGNRILTAAKLVQDGYVSQVLVSGPWAYYGYHESDFAIRFAVEKGCPADIFIPVPHEGLSTREESFEVLKFMRQKGITSYLLVTSDYHTGRARRVFLASERSMGYRPGMRVVAARDKYFSVDGWWHSREGRKLFLMEWLKTFASAFGI